MSLNNSSSEEYEIHVFTPDEILKNKKEKFSVLDGLKRIDIKLPKFNFGTKSKTLSHSARLWRELRPQIAGGAATLFAAAAICLAVNALDFSLGYEVIVDGENIGMVTDKQEVYDAIDTVRADLREHLGANYAYDKDPAFVRRLVANSKISSESDITDALFANIDTMVECCAVYVDGEALFGVSGEDAANWVLAQYKQKYAGETITDDMSVDFCEKVTVKNEFLHIGMLETPEEALNILSGNDKELASYTVKPGDTLWDIADAYGTSVEHLLAINENLSENIKDGMEIRVEASVPKLSVKSVQTVSQVEAVPYEVEKISDDTIYENTTVVAREGKAGSAKVLAKITKVNGIETEKEVWESETLEAPVSQIEKIGTKKRPPTTGSGKFINPTYGTLSSRYGARWGRSHNGIDIAGSYNSDIKAADGGVVTYSGWMSGYGNYIVINHENGYQTAYGHCASLCVGVGARVAKGDVIAKMGNTGRSTGTHLHFEVRKNGSFVDPLGYVGY